MIEIVKTLPTEGLEWYDNSTLESIDRCHRLGYYQNVLWHADGRRPGLSGGAGVGANFGTCLHEGLAKWYGLQTLEDDPRRLAAFRSFAECHEKLFKDPGELDEKYSLARGLDLLDIYFDHYSFEDAEYRSIEPEMTVLLLIEPRPAEPLFEPFHFVIKTDGLFERLNHSDLVLLEHKTSAWGVARILKEREYDRQSEGYVWGLREMYRDRTISGVLLNAIGIYKDEKNPAKLFGRQFFDKSLEQTELWRRETIRKVERWRGMLRASATTAASIFELPEHFDRNTSACTQYGLCGFYNLCKYGMAMVDEYVPNTWNPFN